MNFDAVIFDLDGTLFDSLDDIATAANRVLGELGKPTYSVSEYKQLVGDGLAMLFQRALPECEVEPGLKADCMRRFEHAYAECWNNQSKPYDGIIELLENLNGRSVSLSVLSNKAEDFTKRCVQHFFGNSDICLRFGSNRPIPPQT